MPRRLILGTVGVLACSVLAARAAAQTVLFRIVDDETSAPVFGAIAQLLDAACGDRDGASDTGAIVGRMEPTGSAT